jgi:lipoprotein-anchoring transpeptidase ErfK/SrfK
MIKINIFAQTLEFQGEKYKISSAKNGVGEIMGSFCTPTGRFEIAEKIGENLPEKAVLIARIPTNEIYSKDLAKNNPNQDWILSRILWLKGIDVHNQNTYARYIYIHGTHDEEALGKPNSKGCIRMKNTDIIKIFNAIKIREQVEIR